MVGVTSRNVLMDALRDFMGISERGRFFFNLAKGRFS